jgi:iron complex outermembrane receptor protein
MRKLLGALCAAASFCITAAQADPATTADQTGAKQDQPGYQQNVTETVYVTARRREENVQTVPLNVTAINGDELREQHVQSALDLQNVAPTLTVSGTLGSRDTDVFTIRGQSQPFGGADPGVQTYFNEVPFNASSQGAMYDLDNVQVLSGPQGTLFGRNTTGGAILFQPKKPDDQFGGYIDGKAGDYAMRELSGAINVPLDDTLAVRIAGDVARRHGFTKDVSTGNDLDNLDYDAFRAGVNWTPTSDFQNYLVFDYYRSSNHGTGAALTGVNTGTIDALASQITGTVCTTPPGDPTCGAIEGFELGLQGALANQQALGPRKTTSSIVPGYRRQSWGVTDIARFDITDHLRIRNIFGYRADREQPSFDYDGSFLPLLDIPNSRTWETNSYQLTDEFQLQGESGDDSVQWIAGFYHELDRPNGYSEIERQTLGGPQPFGSPIFGFGSTEFDSLNNGGSSNAVFGQASWKVTDQLALTGGARYTWDHKVADAKVCFVYLLGGACPFPLTSAYAQPTLKDNFRAPTWTVAANYQVTPDTMVYATWRRGYKSGGFNSGAGLATGFAEFKPEYLTDVEVGTKNNWTILGVPGRTDFDAYYGWYQDVQKNDLVQVLEYSAMAPPPMNPPISGSLNALTFNAARAHIQGIDFSSSFVPGENFEVTMFYSYTDARYDKFTLPQQIAVIDAPANVQEAVNPLDHKGDPFAYTPKNKLGLTPSLRIPLDPDTGTLVLSGTLYWQDAVWFTDLSDIETTCSAFTRPAFAGGPYTCLAPGGEAPKQKSYTLLNLRADWDNVFGSSFDASVFMDNVTNETYKVGANALLHLTGTSASIYGPPRMWGVELRARFGADAQ